MPDKLAGHVIIDGGVGQVADFKLVKVAHEVFHGHVELAVGVEADPEAFLHHLKGIVVDDVIKHQLFWRNSGKSRFSPKLKQQEQAILKAINSF